MEVKLVWAVTNRSAWRAFNLAQALHECSQRLLHTEVDMAGCNVTICLLLGLLGILMEMVTAAGHLPEANSDDVAREALVALGAKVTTTGDVCNVVGVICSSWNVPGGQLSTDTGTVAGLGCTLV